MMVGISVDEESPEADIPIYTDIDNNFIIRVDTSNLFEFEIKGFYNIEYIHHELPLYQYIEQKFPFDENYYSISTTNGNNIIIKSKLTIDHADIMTFTSSPKVDGYNFRPLNISIYS